MEYVIAVEEVEALENANLNDLEIELHYQVYLERQALLAA